MLDFKRVISYDRINAANRELGREIAKDYEDKNPLFICVLSGAFMFAADLVRQVGIKCEIDFVRADSYGAGTESSGTVKCSLNKLSLKDRHVIILDEIVDAGHTIDMLLTELGKQGPKSIKVCTLINKIGRREVEVPVDYAGITIEDGFLIGYGLDLDERYRNLSEIFEKRE
jgi:hypoxanthine phosphoribosyltransferase